MKNLVLFLSLSAVTMVSLATYPLGVTHPPNSLIGRWQHTFSKGVCVWTIRPDSTFTVASEGKALANGQYRLKNGIYNTNDPNCNVKYHGRYRFAFFAKDSLRFSVVEDTCKVRRAGINSKGWKRLSDAK